MITPNILNSILIPAFLFSFTVFAQSGKAGKITAVQSGSEIVMNEIYARGTAVEPDWIEIYNSSASTVDISGFKIFDSGGQSGSKAKKLFPAGSTIPAKGFLVIVVDDGDATGFGLSSSGEKVWFENSVGIPIDSVEFQGHTSAQSYSRIPDGGNWAVVDSVTKGAINNSGNSNPVSTANIIMNEVYSRGTVADPDWIEIYNTTSSTVDITGYKIYDSGGQSGAKVKKYFPSGSIIPAKGFLVIVTDDADASGFGLSSSGEKVWFENVTGTVLDSVEFSAHSAVQSFSRIPDGGTWQVSNIITRGLTNGTGTSVSGNAENSKTFVLHQNYPNPFNPATSISYQLNANSFVSLVVFDLMGREIRTLVNKNMEAGNHSIEFDASDLKSGIYICRLQTNSAFEIRKIILMK